MREPEPRRPVLPRAAQNRGLGGRALEAGRGEVGGEDFLEITADGNLPGPATLFGEAQLGLTSGVSEVAAAQLRHGAGASGGIGEQRQYGAIAPGHGGLGVDRGQ